MSIPTTELSFRNKKQRKQQVKLRRPGYAVAKYVRMSPRKVRLVVDVIRGKSVQDAEDLLRFLPKSASEPVAKVLKSAKSNAINNDEMLEDRLFVQAAYVDAGPTLKRLIPRARGSANIIKKRTSHITIIVGERESLGRKGSR
ncbi:50S ribosomal protein L22 [Deinococcus metallilatus]|uniref:Large ribosomal subunit protein uL22 n=1 Tax=Deinococcus metallilatus TaxID=1211322 RepID=A0AAJ5JYJ9_9DEIO|nr:50S ribosomal protein L22 [Deinococcus metallilatus]MBB5296900.1 large subunit ribosomal protein L22 [Deinococcus metallilatus]QBY09630.1 50S ribosomal protein L22 [Deinococcus metallilatus]RXJ09121.1 50S ribosomal protein L22 [Deinococcus metallilatus]TLK20906.1 50S ribosomal protein L22 [Deinococcus metallilatus]GMA13933.1 50S ribosomal protein L22 [Deinococcus metallilatus]